MARWHKRLPTLPHAPTLSTRVLPLSVCVYLSRHTYTHTHTLNRAKMAQRSQWTMPAPHGAAFRGFTCLCVHVCVSVCGAWVWALSCATLCNIFFVICFLCVCLFFGVTRQRRLVFVLVACHTHTHVAACMCVGFVAKCVAVSVCVFQKMLHCFWHARRHRDSLTHAHTQACTQKHTHTYTLLRINQLKKSIWRCHPWVADWRCAVATFVVILWQHL